MSRISTVVNHHLLRSGFICKKQNRRGHRGHRKIRINHLGGAVRLKGEIAREYQSKTSVSLCVLCGSIEAQIIEITDF